MEIGIYLNNMKLLIILSLVAIAVNGKHSDASDADIWEELNSDFEKDEIIGSTFSENIETEEMEDKSDEEIHQFHVRLQDMHQRKQERERQRQVKLQKIHMKDGIACAKKKCAMGKECVIDETDEPICVCAKACAPERSERAMVCSTKNVTFASECELHRQKCLCHREQLGCADPKFAHTHLDYFGPCVELKPCSAYEKSEFPLRMREWLYFVMEELAQRDTLSQKAKDMAKRAEEINADESEDVSETERWMIPAVWKFCELDETHDDLVDGDELMPVIAPLKGMEHCIGSFVESCDSNEDETISKTEWIKCLGLDLTLMEELELKCDAFHD